MEPIVVQRKRCSCGHEEVNTHTYYIYSPARGDYFTLCALCFPKIKFIKRNSIYYYPKNEAELTKLLTL